MSLPCPVPSCDRVMPGHLRVCRACTADLTRALVAVSDLASDLDIARTRQARLDADHSHSTHRGLPWDQRAAEAAGVLRSALLGWYRELALDAPVLAGPACQECEHLTCELAAPARPAPDTDAGLARWLLRHRARLLGHPAVAEAVDELVDAVRQARRAVDRAPDRIYAGPCEQCRRDLYARMDTTIVTCTCGASYGIQARRDWMLGEVQEMLGNASWVAAAARALGYRVTSSAVRGLASRRRITARGHDAMGHPTYRVGDVLDAIGARASA